MGGMRGVGSVSRTHHCFGLCCCGDTLVRLDTGCKVPVPPSQTLIGEWRGGRETCSLGSTSSGTSPSSKPPFCGPRIDWTISASFQRARISLQTTRLQLPDTRYPNPSQLNIATRGSPSNSPARPLPHSAPTPHHRHTIHHNHGRKQNTQHVPDGSPKRRNL